MSTESVCTSRWTRCLTVFRSGTGHSAMPMPSTSPTTSPGSPGPRPATYGTAGRGRPELPQHDPVLRGVHAQLLEPRHTAVLPCGPAGPCPGSLTRMSQQTPDSTLPQNQRAWGHGLATIAEDGTVLDTWFPAPQLGDATGEPAPESLTTLARKYPERRVHTDVVTVSIDLARAAGGRQRRLPAPAPAQPPAGPAARGQRRRHLRHPGQRRVDQPRPVRGGRLRGGAARAARDGPGPGLRGRQVPPDDRLRAAHRRTHRRRRPGAPRRPPRRGHHRDARGLRQLQRRHARRLDGRGPDQRRRRRRRRLRHRRRRLDHGHPVRRRQGDHLHRRALPARRQRRHRHLPGQRLRRRGRAATSPPAPR